jgi:hypothetical protein
MKWPPRASPSSAGSHNPLENGMSVRVGCSMQGLNYVCGLHGMQPKQ